MWQFLESKLTAIIIGAALIGISFLAGVNHEASKRDKQELETQRIYTETLQLKQQRINKITESYNLTITDLQLENQSQKDKINHDKKVIDNLNHINGLFVRYVSNEDTTQTFSTRSANAERIILSDTESVPASKVANYIVDLHTAQKQCVVKLNSLIDYELGSQ